MLAGSPLRTIPATLRTGRAARARTAHPIDSFDMTGQRTLETFDSRAGRTDCTASNRRSDKTARRGCASMLADE
jgi:hypothetical protein